MAYDKPLKIQWTEINGRAVPLVLPQYWSDEQNDWVVSSEQNRLPVDAQLTGRKVEKETILSRKIRNELDARWSVERPYGAIGFIAYLEVHGATGTFGTDEGIRLVVRKRNLIGNDYSLVTITTDRKSGNRPHVVMCYPGVKANGYEGETFKVVPLTTVSLYHFIADINGSFDEGEGFDCELNVEWLY